MKRIHFSLFLLFSLILLFCCGNASYAGVTIPLTSDSAINGYVTHVSFPAPYRYLNVIDASAIVTRMRIYSARTGQVFFDSAPIPGQSITLEPGDYCIACYSNFGNMIPQSVVVFLTDGSDSVQYVSSPPVNYISSYGAYYGPFGPCYAPPYPFCRSYPNGYGPPCGGYYYNSGCGYAGGYYNSCYNSSCWGIRVNAVINIK